MSDIDNSNLMAPQEPTDEELEACEEAENEA